MVTSRFNTAQQLVLTFLGFIGLGTLLLALPQASTSGLSIGFVDALFTSTSATCVTGLIVRDTPVDFTPFGLTVILALIQVGGLGIMTFGFLFARMLGKSANLNEQVLLQEEGTQAGLQGGVGETLKEIARWVFLVEGIGAALLLVYYLLQRHLSGSQAVAYAIFHSVSAFCNAGFALRSDSLMQQAGNWYFNLIIMVLIVIGGIGFGVLAEVSVYLGRKWHAYWSSQPTESPFHFSYHARLATYATVILLVSGTTLFLVAERNTTLAGFGAADRLLRAMFLSVTARTAGFNTVPIESMSAAGIWFMILLMAIGASPGGTGGGIKTTTVAVLVASLRQQFHGEKHAYIWKRRLPDLLIPKAIALSFCFLLFFGGSSFLLMLTENLRMDELLFEAMSALGTVGLSMGITSKLSTYGKLIVTLLMFAGRLGPMTLVLGFRISPNKGEVLWGEDRSLTIG
jgi:trk system potassium uptake protein TrkH